MLLDASWIDRMDGIDHKEMHLASKSASSGRHKIHVRFYLKSDRFGDFWASEWSQGFRSDFGTSRRDLHAHDMKSFRPPNGSKACSSLLSSETTEKH